MELGGWDIFLSSPLDKSYIDIVWIKRSGTKHPIAILQKSQSLIDYLEGLYEKTSVTCWRYFSKNLLPSSTTVLETSTHPTQWFCLSQVFLLYFHPLCSFFVMFTHLTPSFTLSVILTSQFLFPFPPSLPDSASQNICAPLGKDAPLVGKRKGVPY